MMNSLTSGDDVKDSKESLAKEENGHIPDHAESLPVSPPESKADPEAQNGKLQQTWKWSVFFLCFYGFMVQLKPGEPFITPYLLSAEKNFTKEQVSCLQVSFKDHWVNLFSFYFLNHIMYPV